MKDNFLYLLVALLIFIIGVPIAYDLDLVSLRVSRAVAIFCLLAVGVWSLRGASRLFSLGMSVVVAGIILNVMAFLQANDVLHIISLLVLFAFLLLAISSAMQQVAVGTDFSPNRIVGAICIYLMLGVMWTITYSVV